MSLNTIYDVAPPILSAKQIEDISSNLLEEHIPHVLEKPQSIPIAILIEKYLGLNLDFKCLSKKKDVLGIMAYSEGIIEVFDETRKNKVPIYVDRGTILIETELIESNQTGRGRFTMGHEVGHWILHKDFDGVMFKCYDNARKLRDDRDWFEWQADTFSSNILMPRKTFLCAYNNIWKSTKNTKRTSKYGVDEEWDAFIDYAVEELANLFQVSFQAAMIRLKKLNIVEK